VDGGFNWSPVTMISISPDGLNFYIAGLDSNFYAVSNNGILQWKLSLEAVLGSMPVVDNQGNIFITPIQNLLPDSLYLYCINPDGVIKWRVPYSKNSDYWAQYCDLTIDKNGFIYIANNSCDQIISFDYMGQTRWQWNYPNSNEHISSSLVCDANATVYFGSFNYKSLYALLKDGTFKWELPINLLQVCFSPAISDNTMIYVSSGRGGRSIVCAK
jgi:outer membrane protein assembly factor BamB